MQYCEIWKMNKRLITLDVNDETPVVIHVTNTKNLPMEVQGVLRYTPEGKKPNQYALVQACTKFILDRTFPETRQNCREVLQELGLDHFNKLDIIRKTHGLLYHDLYWIKLDKNDPTTYDQIKIRK